MSLKGRFELNTGNDHFSLSDSNVFVPDRTGSATAPPQCAEIDTHKTTEQLLVNATVDQSQFSTVSQSSPFVQDRAGSGSGELGAGRVSPEAQWIDPRLIRHVSSVRRPEPQHRVAVPPPVISAITRTPGKNRQVSSLARINDIGQGSGCCHL